jgi:protease-4
MRGRNGEQSGPFSSLYPYILPPLFAILCAFTLCSAGGCGFPSLLITPVSSKSSLEQTTVREGKGWSPKTVAIVEVEGMLSNLRTGGFLGPQENKVSLFVQTLEEIKKDKDVKAVVLRVNSPGGTVTASDTMYQALVKFKRETKLPVVASTQDVAASGAYYVSCGSDVIVAHPTSVVGSIGVVFEWFNFEGTMGKIGASAYAVKSGPMKDMGSPFRAMRPEERAVMQGMVDEYYHKFVGVVKARHPFPDGQAEMIATDGRVFSGVQAIQYGLVDRTGTLDDAINVAEERAGIKKDHARVVLYRRPYGYSGSIYASSEIEGAKASSNGAAVMSLDVPGLRSVLPTGFYYLWEPG